jgi:hypothetical protein
MSRGTPKLMPGCPEEQKLLKENIPDAILNDGILPPPKMKSKVFQNPAD